MPTASPHLVVEKPGRGIDVSREKDPFPNAIDHAGLDDGWGMIRMITLRERTMLRFMDAVTDKPEWEKKVFDGDIVKKWRTEAVKYNTKYTKPKDRVHFDVEMTNPMFDYSIQELRYRAKQHATSPRGAIYALPGHVYKSDTAISDDLRRSLCEAVKVLEDVPESQMDWHPGSDGKVLDLVHPSLFSLIYEKSLILGVGSKSLGLEDCIDRIGEGEVLSTPTGDTPRTLSKQFQWLPCDVDISGERPRIMTYINNLHPGEHSGLYSIIEEVIAAAIPLWERTLSLARVHALFDAPRRINYTNCKFDYAKNSMRALDWEPEEYPSWLAGEPRVVHDAKVKAFHRRRYERYLVILPEPPRKFDPEPLQIAEFSLKEEVGERPLQVIVKLANIVLTPDKPGYGGGTWHVEGMSNESICATAIYYYSSENITESRLCFRQQSYNFEDEVSYQQGEHGWVHQVFGLMQDHNTIQDLGGVVTREGRLLTFPNILQHRVQPFKLKDPTKPGHRKILALFLVDPTFSIISTADVPPQRHDWWAAKMFGAKHGSLASTQEMKEHIETLPQELKDVIMDYSKTDDFPMTVEIAKQYQEELIEERRKFDLGQLDCFESVQISLCEH